MGLAQTKLHHNVLQENWQKICSRSQTEDGKRWIRTRNPCGDYPLHLACCGGRAPPRVVRALVAAFPGALRAENDLGYRPLELAKINYRRGHPFREDVIGYLEAYVASAGTDPRGGGGGGDHPPPPNGGGGGGEHQPSKQRIVDSGFESGGLDGSTYATSPTCVVCLDDPADHVVAPCGHMCLCGDCARRVLAGRRRNDNNENDNENDSAPRTCPVCRSEFDSIIRVYMPSLDAAVPTAPTAANAAAAAGSLVAAE